jgi:large subunit ribosomal protein L35
MRRSTLLSIARRQLSTSSARAGPSYTPPVKAGVLPAFDEAVKFIQADRETKLKELEALKKDGAEPASLEKLAVEAWANDPETRWKSRNGQGAYSCYG